MAAGFRDKTCRMIVSNPVPKMEEAKSHRLEEDFEGQATHTGPKGVINDWRKFKLESEDSESIPPSKKKILRQMTSPQSRDDKDSKVSRKVICLEKFPVLKIKVLHLFK